MSERITDRELLLQFISSMAQADHLGDAANDAEQVLRLLGPPYSELKWDDFDDLQRHLAGMGIGSLWLTPQECLEED